MQAVIFTEAGFGFGLGHLSRCVALSEYLNIAGFDVKIYNRGDYKSASCVSFDWLNLDIDELIEDNLVIVDSYYASYDLCNYITQKAKICVFFDDFSRMIYPQDSIILNGALGAQKYYGATQNDMFIGVEYGLLRKEFRVREEKKINKEIEKILIFLGGHDEKNYTQMVLDIISRECSYAFVDVVLGKHHKSLHYGFDTNVHLNLSARELKDLMIQSDLAICGGGVTMVELQSTLTPTIALEIAPNQSYQLRAWQREGLRVAQNVYQIKGLLKTLRKFKDRQKLYNRLKKIHIGSKIPYFINELTKLYNEREKSYWS